MPDNETRLEADDIAILRELASRVSDAASDPLQEERRRLWRGHNALAPVRPMILIFPEGSWRELLPDDTLRCQHPWARGAEYQMRMRLYTEEHFDTDLPVESTFNTHRHIGNTGWGLPIEHIGTSHATGAWGFKPIMTALDDAQKLRHPEVTYDAKSTERDLKLAQDVLGDILDVQLVGIAHAACHLTQMLTQWRGMDQVCLDMLDDPEWVHDTMAFLAEGMCGLTRQWDALNLFSLNNRGEYHSSGGVGYTDELPGPDFDSAHVHPHNLWGSAESQEMTMISPDMHRDLVMRYEARFLEPFALNGYGCCDDLSEKLEAVCALPNMRRISISPFARVPRAAEQLGDRYILSWKPPPSDLVGSFDEQAVRTHIRDALEAARQHNCVIEMILKDTHTCEHHPERFTRWSEIAREEVNRICMAPA